MKKMREKKWKMLLTDTVPLRGYLVKKFRMWRIPGFACSSF